MEENKQASGEHTETSGQGGNEETVKFSSYQKVLTEKKNTAAKLLEAMARLESLEEDKMAAEGNKDALIKSLQDKNRSLNDDLTTTKSSYAWNSLEAQVKSAAKLAGCKNPESLVRLMNENDLKALAAQADDNFKLPQDALGAMIEEQKKTHADIGLFGNSTVNHHPFTGNKVTTARKDFASMTREELAAEIKNFKE